MLRNRIIMIAPLGLVGLTILSGAFLMSSYSFADDSTIDKVNITVPVSCSIEGIGMNTHNANIVNGTYQADIGTTSMKAYCNDNEGFAIYANGYTGNTLGNNKLIGSSTANEIVTGTATSAGSPDISNWAMKLAAGTGTYPLTLDNGFGSYSSVPASYTKVAHRDSGTDLGTSAEGSTLTSTYAAYISKTQPADIYQGQVIYTLVHPASEEPLSPKDCEGKRICYYPNSSAVTGQMGQQTKTTPTGSTDITNGSSVTLWVSNFKRDGYGFAGWNTEYDVTGTNYGPNQTITTPSDIEEKGLSLYAKWIKSAGSMQEFTDQKCLSMSTNDVTALTDERDGNTYAIARLADGKCWMIENLRLDDSVELSSSNTNNPSLPLKNSWYYLNQQGTLTTSNHLSATSDPTSTDPDTAWCQTNASECDDQSMLAINNTTNYISNVSSVQNSDIYGYGNYYNWYSATAGHGRYASGSGYNAYTAPGDICPEGWHLPTGDTTGDYYALNNALSDADTGMVASNNLRSYPNNFVNSGYVSGSSVFHRGVYGNYWASNAFYRNSNYAFYLSFHNGAVYPGTSGHNKYNGNLVRCVADG